MALPSRNDLVARYPEFADVSSAEVEASIEEAGLWVDSTWREGDRTPAILSLAAHFMATRGLGAGGGGAGIAITGPVSAVAVGDVRTQFAGAGSQSGGGSVEAFDTTVYGQRFLSYRRRNFPPVALT